MAVVRMTFSKPIDLGRLSDALAKWLSVPLLGCRSASEGSIPVESGARIFNQQELLDRLMNDRSLAARVLDEFLRDAPLQLGNLEERLNAADAVGGEVLSASGIDL